MRLPKKSYANRGMDLEHIVTMANQVYMGKGIAAIIKIPTSWKILWKNNGGYRQPVKAFPTEKSWLDYVGIVDGVAVTFDAKETNNKTSFPLSNVKAHQIASMRCWQKSGGVSFLLVWWKQKNEAFLLPYEVLMKVWDDAQKGGRKSITYRKFETDAIRIHSGNGVYFDWITAYQSFRGE